MGSFPQCHSEKSGKGKFIASGMLGHIAIICQEFRHRIDTYICAWVDTSGPLWSGEGSLDARDQTDQTGYRFQSAHLVEVTHAGVGPLKQNPSNPIDNPYFIADTSTHGEVSGVDRRLSFELPHLEPMPVQRAPASLSRPIHTGGCFPCRRGKSLSMA